MAGVRGSFGNRTAELVAALGILLACSGCVGGSAGTSSADAERDAKAVLRADLKQGATGQTAAGLGERFIRVPGVSSTRGDGGTHVWVYTNKDGTESQIAGIRDLLKGDLAVASVQRER